MKKVIALLLMTFTLAACSKPGSKLLDDISGVWRAQDGSMVTINSTEKGMFFVLGEKDIDVKLGETDEEQGTVNLNVTLNDGKPAIWTIKQIWDKEHKNFTLGFTLHDGTQDELSFVRKVSASEMDIIERNRASALAASAPSITAAASAAATNEASAPSVPAANSVSEPTFSTNSEPTGPGFDCAKAGTAVEGMICGNQQASRLDLQLSETYKQYLSLVEDKNSAKSEQVSWLKQTRNACKTPECLINAYQARISDLEPAIQYLSKPSEFQ